MLSYHLSSACCRRWSFFACRGKPLKTHQHGTETTTLQSTCLSLSTCGSFTDSKKSQYPCWNYTQSNLHGIQQTNSAELQRTRQAGSWVTHQQCLSKLLWTMRCQEAQHISSGTSLHQHRMQLPEPSWSLCCVLSPGCVHLVQESCDPFCSRDTLSTSRTSVKPWHICQFSCHFTPLSYTKQSSVGCCSHALAFCAWILMLGTSFIFKTGQLLSWITNFYMFSLKATTTALYCGSLIHITRAQD